jgi:penicillin G amidase
VAALADSISPQLNFVFADVDGSIGYYAPGRVPIRGSGNGFYARRGWMAEDDWKGFVPFAELPQLADPPGGTIVNANNRVAGDGYPYFLSRDYDAPFRAERILAMLDETKKGPAKGKGKAAARTGYEPQDAVRMQSDELSLMAKKLLPVMTNFEPDAALGRRIMSRMRTWNGRMTRDNEEPLIFYAWLRRLNRAVYEDEIGDEVSRFWSLRPLFMHFVLTTETGAKWCDDTRTPAVETCRQLLETTLIATLDDLTRQFGNEPNDWRWGDVHKARFDHALFGAIPGLAWIANLSIETDGGEDTVNRGGIRPWDERDPFAHVHGAGFRGVYELSDLSRSRFVIATGQSGHILSPHYRGLMQLWRNGGFIVLGKSREAMDREARLRIDLVPE